MKNFEEMENFGMISVPIDSQAFEQYCRHETSSDEDVAFVEYLYKINALEHTCYDVVCWPESQDIMHDDGIILINNELGLMMFGSSAFLCPNN